MQPFRKLTSTVQPLDRANVDTDQIIPKQFLKRIERTGYEDYLFLRLGKDPDFELNHPRHKGAEILVAGKNFGCGSSREHAAWALNDYGFRCRHRAQLRRHLPLQRRQERHPADYAARRASQTLLLKAKHNDGYKLTVSLEDDTITDITASRQPVSRSIRFAAIACWKASTISA